jgi:hypothetical protein
MVAGVVTSSGRTVDVRQKVREAMVRRAPQFRAGQDMRDASVLDRLENQ